MCEVCGFNAAQADRFECEQCYANQLPILDGEEGMSEPYPIEEGIGVEVQE